jgi:branched-chain amino acid transport system permease protein
VILTLGISEFIKYVVIASEAALGRNGRLLIGTPSLAVLFEAMLALAVISMLLLQAVRSSRLGVGLFAIREDETAAEAVGVNAAALKLFAFTLSAFIPGLVGGLMIMRSTYFEPLQAFSPTTSFTIVTIAILGGSDEVSGPLLGALFLVLLSELLWTRAPELYMIILGVLLIGFVLFVPEGLVGRAQRLLGSTAR